MYLSSSGKGLNDGEHCHFFASCDSGSADACQIAPVGFCDTFDQPKNAQTFEITGEFTA